MGTLRREGSLNTTLRAGVAHGAGAVYLRKLVGLAGFPPMTGGLRVKACFLLLCAAGSNHASMSFVVFI